jgi:hypothetical protein
MLAEARGQLTYPLVTGRAVRQAVRCYATPLGARACAFYWKHSGSHWKPFVPFFGSLCSKRKYTVHSAKTLSPGGQIPLLLLQMLQSVRYDREVFMNGE